MMRKNNVLRKYIASFLLFLLFETVAITLWKAKGNLFYLLNFCHLYTMYRFLLSCHNKRPS